MRVAYKLLLGRELDHCWQEWWRTITGRMMVEGCGDVEYADAARITMIPLAKLTWECRPRGVPPLKLVACANADWVAAYEVIRASASLFAAQSN